MAAGEPQSRPSFTFKPLHNKTFTFLEDRDITDLFIKWSMHGRISVQAFSFDEYFQPYQKDDFVLTFFQDPNVVSNLKFLSSAGQWTTLGAEVKNIKAEALTCSQISMSFFDCLYSKGIVRETGHITKCLDEFYEDIPISDELRKHLCLGGMFCQFEDMIDPYLNTTKSIYKDLVSVQKDPETKLLNVLSTVFKVSAYNANGRCYPSAKEHEQTFAYLIVDPLKHYVNVLYHSFGGGLFYG
ncbi:cilia- and flagella-associated protein 300 isoform X2 [Latimeria chalumnae]|uniref:cilia- and flagella-associated protein 300 isoform X2 n=1 Tax=Latimeria chalumnae TaxID=7897 RepID=UPI0003C1A86F|nr:PREDICTED: uncharacterized protein C11orf70 homolog isoform X3 [Latimeria chalumnae]|eukprot:XP_006009480.1 PREDICTED: uncharacterized protein C11orf70 homolog isoform X3 [Latimeria chalumnae]